MQPAMSRLRFRSHAIIRVLAATLLVAGTLCTVSAATFDPIDTASATPIDAVVIRLRDDVAAASLTSLPPGELNRIANQLRTGLVESGRTRDGAFKLTFSPALSVEAARAAINRVRMLPGIVYADMVSSAPPATSKTKAVSETRRLQRLIVKYKDPTMSYRAERNLPLGTAELDQIGAAAQQPAAHERAMGGGAYLVRLLKAIPRGELEAAAARIGALPGVEFALVDDLKFPSAVPNDPLYANQWHYKSPPAEMGGVNLPPAWDLTTGSASVFIAVIDTGILPHPDLAGRVTTGYDMIDDNLVANDGDYRDPDPVDSGDWITTAEATSPGGWFEGCYVASSSWHGTHVSGTIAAASNNGVGVAGVNWISKIVPVRVLGKCGGYTSDIVDGMRWAAGLAVPGVPFNQNPAKVMNLSLGGGGPCSSFEQNAINAIIAAGSTIVIAAGNENENASGHSPGNCNGVITVAATGRAGQRAQYSNFGSIVEIAAPGGADGDYILSTLNTGSTTANPTGYYYEYYGGTSMATPHVAGIVSLMLSVNPTMTPAQVLSTIQTTARAFPTNTARNCTTAICGAGIIDAYA
ncbi:MAG: S8 family serine peptidase, partial [Betaproteobacteria bacterium]